jgi:2-aminobenzoate-CoA ligase
MTDTRRTTSHTDTFVLDHLPPASMRPMMAWSGLPDPGYPEWFNCASELLDTWAQGARGDRVVFYHAHGSWTYRRLFEKANRIAHVLVKECGLAPGGRVLIRAANQPMLVACWFGVLKAGGIAVTTMPLLRVRELSEIIDKAAVRLALTDTTVAADLEAAMAATPGARVMHFNTIERPPGSLDALMAAQPTEFENVLTAADDPAIIAFTSGTTGRSKGTVHTHRDLLAATDAYGRHVLRPKPNDIFIGSPPIAFTYGLGGLVLFPMRVGAATALIEQGAAPQMLAGIAKYRATITISSPTGYRAMLKQVTDFNVRSLRRCVSAGETLPAATFNAWHATTGIRLMDGIGSTELLHMFIGCTAEDAKPGATGVVVPGYEAMIVDDSGREVPHGTVGRLAVRGPTGCRYLSDLDNQRAYVQRGWNITGDAYHVDDSGYFWYHARTDDMIISSGYNISGPEIENVLLTHPAVAECAVVGLPDEARGHVVKAFIVLVPGSSASDVLTRELQDYVKAELAPYKYPRAIEFAPELPRTLTGKIQRYRLRSKTSGPWPSGLKFHEPEGWARPSGYANAVSASGRTVFIAGQIGWDPATSEFRARELGGQVRQALANVVAALAAAGGRPDQITRMTWYITDQQAYAAERTDIGGHYREIIGRHFPAMTMVVVKALIEPGALVEIEATAVVE